MFVCFQHDLEAGFVTVQNRLAGEPLEEYIQGVGGGYFFAPPGVTTSDGIIGGSLLPTDPLSRPSPRGSRRSDRRSTGG